MIAALLLAISVAAPVVAHEALAMIRADYASRVSARLAHHDGVPSRRRLDILLRPQTSR
jgi:hypothetical protein